jgi:hypothetical protein
MSFGMIVGPALGTGYLLWPLLVVWGGAATGIYAVGLPILGDCFGAAELAAASAVFAMAFELGSVTGPTASGKALCSGARKASSPCSWPSLGPHPPALTLRRGCRRP